MLILGPSKIHGVGVLTTKTIRRGELLQLVDPKDWRFVSKPKKKERDYCQRFCVWDGEGYHCPKDFKRMSLGWYLNDSERPNLAPEGFRFRARRRILAGEELTGHYDEL